MARAPSKKLISTAYHEAGHAVVAWYGHITIKYATIVPEGAYVGMVRTEKIPTAVINPVLWGHVTPAKRDRIERHVMVCYAGGIAERRHKGRHDHIASFEDRANAMELLEPLSSGSRALEAYCRWMYERTVDMVDLRWLDIDAIAQALIERSTLTHSDVTDILLARLHAFMDS